MAQSQMSYPLEFIKRMTLQYPVEEAAEKSRERRYALREKIHKEMLTFAEINQTELLALSDAIVKFMEYEVNMLVPSKKEIGDFISKLEYLQTRFKYTTNYLTDVVEPQDKRDIFLPFMKDEFETLDKYDNLFLSKLNEKKEWDSVDSCIASYYRLYSEANKAYYRKLRYNRTSESIERSLLEISYLLLFYKPIILAYIRGKKIDKRIVAKRLAELRIMLKPMRSDFEFITNNIYKNLAEVAPSVA